jgi:hypothetical protein
MFTVGSAALLLDWWMQPHLRDACLDAGGIFVHERGGPSCWTRDGRRIFLRGRALP